MRDTSDMLRVRQKYDSLSMLMDERMRRQWAAAEAMSLGWGGVSCVATATGLARNTVALGLRELQERSAHPPAVPSPRTRMAGGGRKPITEVSPGIEDALDRLVDPMTRGHPESPLRWTCKSTRKLAAELVRQGFAVSDRTVAGLLRAADYSLQANRKTREGRDHPDRDAQFLHINGRVRSFQRRNQPVISVDTKKKELVGDYRNAGEEWRPAGDPEQVRVHDFPDPELGKAIPYGVYDVTSNEGWVSVGIDHDTAQFAASSIRHWWREMGASRFPRAGELMITSDGGGSNSSRNRLWKVSLQELADETGLIVRMFHFPPGTSKWNKIEHRLFSYITKNWRGRPLVSHEAIVELIASTTTVKGLTVRAALDTTEYETGIKVSDEQMAGLNLTRGKFHGEWNYSIKPKRR